VLVSEAGRVVLLSHTYEGSTHDKNIVDQEGWLFPAAITLHQDLGFKGHSPEGVNVQMPDRKPRTKDLTEEQKRQNKQKASLSVKVEHCIGRVKIYRVLKDRIRMYKKGIKDLVMELGCGIINFKLAYKT
jgi:hypothetical protein